MRRVGSHTGRSGKLCERTSVRCKSWPPAPQDGLERSQGVGLIRGVRSLGRGGNDVRPVSPSNLTMGHHYALSFFDDAVEEHRVEYCQLSVLKDKHG